MSINSTNALLLIDFINDIVNQKGKVSGKGYANYINKHKTLNNLEQLLVEVRKVNWQIIHIRIGFSSDYKEQPKHSPLFGLANKFGAFQINQWGCEFHEKVQPLPTETVLHKFRVSPFFGTSLDCILRNQGIDKLYICGVATDLAVQSAVKDAHDRDYYVTVISDCCIATDENDHQHALRMMKKVATLKTSQEVSKIASSTNKSL